MCSETGLTPLHPRSQQILGSWTVSRGARSLVRNLPGRRHLRSRVWVPVSTGLCGTGPRPLWCVPSFPAWEGGPQPSCPEVCLQAGLRSPPTLLSVHSAPRRPPAP